MGVWIVKNLAPAFPEGSFWKTFQGPSLTCSDLKNRPVKEKMKLITELIIKQ